MAKFLIKGNKKLSGIIKVSGSKNAALPLLAASLLVDGEVVLKNIPKIKDTQIMLEILKHLGSKINFKDNSLIINNKNIVYREIPPELSEKIRGSILFAGPLLFRFGKAEINKPGGCLIGKRPITTHLNAFKSIGVKIIEKNNKYFLKLKKLNLEKPVILDEMSVTATENILMALAFSGKIKIRLASFEPEVIHLAEFLKKLGANFKNLGTPFLEIEEGKILEKKIVFENIFDRIEAATYIILAAMVGRKIEIQNVPLNHLDCFLNTLKKIGLEFSFNNDKVIFEEKEKRLKPIFIRTDIYPNFPTDCAPLISVLLTQCNGQSFIFETMYDERLNYLKELVKMGADIEILSSYLAAIKGPTFLRAASVKALDLRSGAALVLAALNAEGETQIDNIEIIERGYENIEEKLKNIGAEIKRVEE